jgi:hypothetical protein
VNRAHATSTRRLRQLSAGAAAVVLVQILLLQQPDLGGRLFHAASAGLVQCIVFGLIAFVIWLATDVRWPLIAWTVVVLFIAIEQTLAPTREVDAFGDFADRAAVTAPLLSAHGSTTASRWNRITNNGE